MQTDTLADVLTELLTDDFNVKVTVSSEAGRGSSESWQVVESGIEALLIPLNSKARSERSNTDYAQTVTDECYLSDVGGAVVMGRLLTVTHVRNGEEDWSAVTGGNEYIVLGGERQHWDADATRTHFRYDLWRQTKGM
jgi:hypothetical protein